MKDLEKIKLVTNIYAQHIFGVISAICGGIFLISSLFDLFLFKNYNSSSSGLIEIIAIIIIYKVFWNYYEKKYGAVKKQSIYRKDGVGRIFTWMILPNVLLVSVYIIFLTSNNIYGNFTQFAIFNASFILMVMGVSLAQLVFLYRGSVKFSLHFIFFSIVFTIFAILIFMGKVKIDILDLYYILGILIGLELLVTGIIDHYLITSTLNNNIETK